MEETRIQLHSAFVIDRVDPRVFGGFLEHIGRAVYEGVYQPDSAHADEEGWRGDVLAALERLDMTLMRYPGGNFVSGYHWEHGVGPRERRPTVRELAWRSIEPNQVGTDEFISLSRKMGWSPMLAVNLGTGTPEEARNWVEYCNGPPGTQYADMRVAHGSRDPHDVKLWCLGNEMDGPWQLGHVPAEHYAMRAQQAAMLMKLMDPSIELVACGSSSPMMPTYPEWDREVLEYLGGLAHYISLHRYVDNRADDTPGFLAVTNSIDAQIETVDALCRLVHAKRRYSQRPFLCFDEWNVWYRTQNAEGMDPRGEVPPHLVEEVYNLEDALVVAGFLNSFIRHADCLKVANLAQIVNVIAPLLTRDDELLIQSIFYPFEMYSKRRDGLALRAVVSGPSYSSVHGEVSTIDCSAILDGAKLQLFATNRSLEEVAEISVDLADRDITGLDSAELLTGPDAKAANSFDAPDVVCSRAFDDVVIRNGRAQIELPPLSLLAATLNLGA